MSGQNRSRQNIATPPGKPGGLGGLLIERGFTAWASKFAIRIATLIGKPVRIGKTVLAIRYADVREALSRDLDFIIKPVNDPPFEVIGYRFVLGMDRSAELARERAALYKALARVDMAKLQLTALHAAHTRIAAADGNIDVVENYARPIAAGTAQALFGLRGTESAQLMDAARAVFYYGFLDGAGSPLIKARAVSAAELMSGWFDAEITKRRESRQYGDDLMGALLAQAEVSDDQIRRTLGGMFVGSIDPVAGATARIMTVMMRDDNLRESATRDADNIPALMSWCLEAMRRWPNGPILGRKAARDTMLGGTKVSAGMNIILWTQAAMFDPSAFPAPFMMRRDRDADAYLHFGAGLHPCAGRSINAWQLPILVGQLLKQRPTKLGKMRWAGPFPAHLPLDLTGGSL